MRAGLIVGVSLFVSCSEREILRCGGKKSKLKVTSVPARSVRNVEQELMAGAAGGALSGVFAR